MTARKEYKKILIFLLFCMPMILLINCRKFKNAPCLSTISVTAISNTSAVTGGEIKFDGGDAIISKGVCWNTHQDPTIGDHKTDEGTGMGSYTSTISGLNPHTTYYVRAYATSSSGTGYGIPLLFCTLQDSSDMVTDFDGNRYHILNIGSQVWMAENLNVIHFRNGDPIPNVTDDSWGNLSTAAYCSYNNNDTTTAAAYGRLYNWFAVNDSRNICPTGWHVPTEEEWTSLTDYVGGVNIAGNKLKEKGMEHWIEHDGDASNESGFTALPGGWRHSTGHYYDLQFNGYWWSSTEHNDAVAGKRGMDHWSMISTCAGLKIDGFSVRCIKD